MQYLDKNGLAYYRGYNLSNKLYFIGVIIEEGRKQYV